MEAYPLRASRLDADPAAALATGTGVGIGVRIGAGIGPRLDSGNSALEGFAAGRFVLKLDQSGLEFENLEKEAVLNASSLLQPLVNPSDLPRDEIAGAQLRTQSRGSLGIVNGSLLDADFPGQRGLTGLRDDLDLPAIDQARFDGGKQPKRVMTSRCRVDS